MLIPMILYTFYGKFDKIVFAIFYKESRGKKQNGSKRQKRVYDENAGAKAYTDAGGTHYHKHDGDCYLQYSGYIFCFKSLR